MIVLEAIAYLGLFSLALANTSPSKYTVKLHSSKVSSKAANQFLALKDAYEIEDGEHTQSRIGTFQKMRSYYGTDSQKNHDYLCYVPPIASNTSQAGDSNGSDYNDDARVQDSSLLESAVEILNQSFSTKECIFAYGLNGGYFTFAYCFGDKIIQYHENMEYFIKTNIHKPEHPDYIFILGRFEGSNFKETKIENQCNWNEIEAAKAKGNTGAVGGRLFAKDFQMNDDTVNPFNQKNIHSTQKFIQHTLSGSLCDLTEEPRTIDIIYKCDPVSDAIIQILDVNEIKTCEYQMVINVPQLCALKEFQQSEVENEVVEIACKEINDGVSRDLVEEITVDSFLKNKGDLLPVTTRDLFPINKNYKIVLSEYSLIPFGMGFFSALSRLPIESTNVYFKFRHVLVYNGFYDSPMDLIQKFGRMFQNLIGRKILAPAENERKQRVITWDDSFVAWFELYDFYGNFVSLIRVDRDAKDGNDLIKIQLVDPDTMLDQDGDYVEIHEYVSPHGAVNFENFIEGTEVKDVDAASLSTEFVTVFVTRSEDSPQAQETGTAIQEQAEGQHEEVKQEEKQQNEPEVQQEEVAPQEETHEVFADAQNDDQDAVPGYVTEYANQPLETVVVYIPADEYHAQMEASRAAEGAAEQETDSSSHSTDAPAELDTPEAENKPEENNAAINDEL